MTGQHGVAINLGRILVVDDDQEVREAMCDVLSDEGYDVISACHGADALAVLGRTAAPPAVIVLDLTMPVMDGYEFLDRRSAEPSIGRIPVVVVSATIDNRIDMPGVVVVRKPIDLQALLDIVGRQIVSHAA